MPPVTISPVPSPARTEGASLQETSAGSRVDELGLRHSAAPRNSLARLRLKGNLAHILKLLTFRRRAENAAAPETALARYSFSPDKTIAALARHSARPPRPEALQKLSGAELERITRRLDSAPMRLMMEKAAARDPDTSPLPDIARNMQALRAQAAGILQERGFDILPQPARLNAGARRKAETAGRALERRLDDHCRTHIGITRQALPMQAHLALDDRIRQDAKSIAASKQPQDHLAAQNLKAPAPFTVTLGSASTPGTGETALADLVNAYTNPEPGGVSLSGRQFSHALGIINGRFATLAASNSSLTLDPRSRVDIALHDSAATTLTASVPVNLPAGLDSPGPGEAPALLLGAVENHYGITRDDAGNVRLAIDSQAPVTNGGEGDTVSLSTRLLLPADGSAPAIEVATQYSLRLSARQPGP